MLGKDARIEEEDRAFDHSDRRSIEVLEDVKDVVPLLRRVRASHCHMLAKVEMGRCPSDQPLGTRLFWEVSVNPPIKLQTGNIHAKGSASIMA